MQWQYPIKSLRKDSQEWNTKNESRPGYTLSACIKPGRVVYKEPLSTAKAIDQRQQKGKRTAQFAFRYTLEY
jgi:hypothetical protein